MYPHYGMLDLMDAKRQGTITVPSLAEVQDEKSAPNNSWGGVFLFRLIDELVIYLLPISYKSGKNITGRFNSDNDLRESKIFRNNVCRLVYSPKE